MKDHYLADIRGMRQGYRILEEIPLKVLDFDSTINTKYFLKEIRCRNMNWNQPA
jgi:hypothetical protein